MTINSITTISGRDLDLDDPNAGDIQLLDISQALANCSAYKDLKGYYSIAQRNVNLSRWIDPSLSLYALFHQAWYAYSDSPNVRLDTAIKEAFGVQVLLEHAQVDVTMRGIDQMRLSATKVDQFNPQSFLSPAQSHSLFMQRYLELTD